MKKAILSILVIVLLVFITGCFNDSTNQTTKELVTDNYEKDKRDDETKIYCAFDFIGMNVEELEKMYGNEYDTFPYQGAYEIIYSKPKIPYSFNVLLNDTIPLTDRYIKSVNINSGGYITKDTKIGMTVNEIEEKLGFSINAERDEELDKICAGFRMGEYTVFIYFNDDYVSENAFVKISDKE